MEIKTKINKCDLIKLKSFSTAKQVVCSLSTKTPSEWEKITANETTDKRLISKIYKQLIEVNWRRNGNPLLPGEFRGQRSLVGCCPWGHTELDTTEAT